MIFDACGGQKTMGGGAICQLCLTNVKKTGHKVKNDKGALKMDLEKKLAIMQNVYAASIAETVNSYEKLKVLEHIVVKKKERQAQTAPYMNQQLGIGSIEGVFTGLADIFGCANWKVEKTVDGYIATATACKLCALSKKMGGANPCQGWCLDPMAAMITAVTNNNVGAEHITVQSTLMDGDCCTVKIVAG